MRISMSGIGSLMLIDVSLPSFLPTCLDHAWYFAAQRQVAQLVAPQAELAVHATRPAGQRAAVAQAHRGGVARQLLQLVAGRVLGLVGGARVVDHLEQSLAPRSVTMQPTGKPARTLKFAIDLRALVTTGFCPAILVMSARALSSVFLSVVVSPTPMLSVILCRRGTCITVL